MQLADTDMQTAKVALGGSPLLAPRSRRSAGPSGRRVALPTRAVAEPSQAVPFLSDADHLKKWSHDSWRNYPALQQPAYPDKVGRCKRLLGLLSALAAAGHAGSVAGPAPTTDLQPGALRRCRADRAAGVARL